MEAAHGFFEGRRQPKIRPIVGGKQKRWAEYENVPIVIAAIVSHRMATLHELQSVYGAQDAYDLVEIIRVDDYNQALARQE
jgi:hypothetical protein